jgi:hypothetical protein
MSGSLEVPRAKVTPENSFCYIRLRHASLETGQNNKRSIQRLFSRRDLMSLMPTAPRSIGGVLDDAIRLYRKTLMPCFPLLLIGVLITTAPAIWLTLLMPPMAATDPERVLAVFRLPAVWLTYLVIILAYSAVYCALIYQIDAIARGQRLSLGEAVGMGLKRLPTLFGVTILFALMVTCGLILLVIPGIWLWGVFQLAFVAAIIERTGIFESFGVSRRLVRGNWWRANVIIFVAVVMLIVLMMVFGMIAGVAMVATGGAATALSTGAQVTQQIIAGILNLFTLSFYPCVLLAVYHDLKLRKEGADLVDRVGALTPAG